MKKKDTKEIKTRKERKPHPRTITFTDEEIRVIEQLAGVGCNLEMIGHILSISKSTMDRKIKNDPVINEAIERGRAKAGSQVLNTAYKMATSGTSPWMTGFWLKCRLGWKEPKDPIEKDERDFELSYKK